MKESSNLPAPRPEAENKNSVSSSGHVDGQTGSQTQCEEDLKLPEQQKATNPCPIIMLDDTEAACKALQGIRLAAIPEKDAIQVEDGTTDLPADAAGPAFPATDLTVPDKKACSLCDIEFQDRKDQFEHYKSDWHRFNLKQRMRGCAAVNVDTFEELMGDVSSISGSESDDGTSDCDTDPGRDSPRTRSRQHPAKARLQAILQDRSSGTDSESEGGGHIEGIGRRHPKVFLRNRDDELLSLYRCVVHGKKNQPESQEDLLSRISQLPQTMKWAVVMVAGGHFAAAVFNKSEVVAHKTFHRYVVRAKRGTAQSTRDAQGNAPKSAGARLRRYNEQALKQDILELLTEQWKEQLAQCDCVFLRAPSYNKLIFFGGKRSLFDKADTRIRMIPFQTRRPTQNEVYRVRGVLASLTCHGKDGEFTDHIASPRKVGKGSTQREDTPKKTKSKVQAAIPDIVVDSEEESSSGDEEDILLRMVEHTTLTSELKEYECTRPPRRNKKHKAKKTVAEEAVKTGVILDEETVQWRNKVYTTCKTGDLGNLRQLIETFCADPYSNNSTAAASKPVGTPVTSEAAAVSTVAGGQNTDNLNSSTAEETPECSFASQSESANVTASETSAPKDVTAVLQAVLNMPFGESQTSLLHVASKAGHGQIVWQLMLAGADICLRDKHGQLPYTVAADKPTRNEFRRFRGDYPDKYDYEKAQVPEPLSTEREEEKKAKEAEKKKAQRKARKEKLKVQKAEAVQQRQETQEKDRFLALSDREKRALAAEKRLSAQMTSEGQTSPVLRRCFQCAADMTGKVPFEYYDYLFCTSKCLQKHKQNSKSTAQKS